MKAVVLSKSPEDAYKLLGALVAMWQSRFVIVCAQIFLLHIYICVCICSQLCYTA